MEDKKYRFGKIRWWQWVLLFIAVPIVMWVLMLIPTIPIDNLINETHWLSFFGGYIGACITGLITLYVLRLTSLYNTKNLKLTLKQNQANHKELVELQNTTNDKNEALNRQNREQSEKQNQENRQQNETLSRENREQNEKLNRRQQQLQINTTLYVQEQANIEKLRNMLDENYRTIDFQRFAIAVNYMQLGNFEYANQLLMFINRDVEMCGSKSDLYLPVYRTNEADEEKEYRELFKKVMIKYGALVNDFIFVNSLLIFLRETTPLINTIHEFTRNSFETMKKHVALDPLVAEEYNSEDNIYQDILNLKAKSSFPQIIKDINDVVVQRLNKVISAHVNKGALLNATQNLLAYREEQAKRILTEKLED